VNVTHEKYYRKLLLSMPFVCAEKAVHLYRNSYFVACSFVCLFTEQLSYSITIFKVTTIVAYDTFQEMELKI
jgi:hypothetical protein